MSEEEVKSVNNQETAAPVANSTAQVENPPSTTEPEEGSKEFNFARLREKAEKAEKKNEQLEKTVNELKESLIKVHNLIPKKQEPERDPDDMMTYGEFQRITEERERAELPNRARSKHADFDSIMTEENIKKLETEEPELANACAKASNPWEATYKILKKFVISQNTEDISKNEKRIKENLSKPLSSNAVGRDSPLRNADIWATASRDQLYKEMMEAASRAR